ncbi:MAG: SOS response-associated peptidase [Terracidiphilus sp.]|jgi:putative SOS response-associated peptidase YedK
MATGLPEAARSPWDWIQPPALAFGYSLFMCGRFARQSTQEVLADWFGVELEEMPWFAPTWNAAPQSVQPVVRLQRDSGRREFALLRWGLVPFWAKDAKFAYSTFNARTEEAAAKPAFREALRKRRCLVPADAFYEWQRLDPKTKRPYAIALRSGEPCALAGLWERWEPREGEALETFTVLTTDPNALMEPIHNRMPVILEPRDYARWLEGGDPARPPVDLLRPYPAEKMRAWPVSDRVGNVRNNDAELLAPS